MKGFIFKPQITQTFTMIWKRSSFLRAESRGFDQTFRFVKAIFCFAGSNPPFVTSNFFHEFGSIKEIDLKDRAILQIESSVWQSEEFDQYVTRNILHQTVNPMHIPANKETFRNISRKISWNLTTTGRQHSERISCGPMDHLSRDGRLWGRQKHYHSVKVAEIADVHTVPTELKRFLFGLGVSVSHRKCFEDALSGEVNEPCVLGVFGGAGRCTSELFSRVISLLHLASSRFAHLSRAVCGNVRSDPSPGPQHVTRVTIHVHCQSGKGISQNSGLL